MPKTGSLLVVLLLFLIAVGAVSVGAAAQVSMEPLAETRISRQAAGANVNGRDSSSSVVGQLSSASSGFLQSLRSFAMTGFETAEPCVPVTDLALSHAPIVAYTTTSVLFSAEILTGSLPATYTWAFGDGTVPVTGTSVSAGLTTTHIFTDAGAYTTSLAAHNACTLEPALEVVTVTVVACQPISGTSIAHWPAVPRAGQVVEFTATVTQGLPGPDYEWAFGDGEVAVGAVVTHSYSAPLTYTMALTATNLCSQQIVTKTIAVAPRLKLYLPLIRRGEDPFEPLEGRLGYGASIAASYNVSYLADMGFDWAMGFVRWTDVGTGPNYNWQSVDWQLADYVPRTPHVLLRVHHPTPEGIGDPPVTAAELTAFRTMTQALAAYVAKNWRPRGLETIAYEVWNEPNLSTEWGIPQTQPSAAQYTALLKAGYQGIRAGDAQAIVVSAGLATTGGSLYATAAERAAVEDWARWFYGADAAVGDLVFLRNMYLNGAKGYFDALGTHPYGGPDAPETPPSEASGPIYFRRAEEQRAVMLSFRDPSPMWATEVGWILETSCYLGPFEWMEVSEAEQAQYLVDAYAYAQEHWPWMGPMVIFNLDFATVFYYDICEQMRYYSLVYREDPAGGAILTRQAFSSLRDMPKASDW
ncbi:MAG: PKD domain-containing protein [Anaerolineae bacterium]